MGIADNTKKIAIIVQRYGSDVNGGAEVHARMIAHQLSRLYDITVLTSCAVDQRWNPVLPSGTGTENGIRVIRFVNKPRDRKKQRYYMKKMRGKLPMQQLYRSLKKPRWFQMFSSVSITEKDNNSWLRAQGPEMPELISYLINNRTNYSAFIFFTALYYPTAIGILEVGNKSILIPTMHDEPVSYFPVYKKVMSAPAWIFFNTPSEKRLSEKLFDISHVKQKIVAVGIDLIEETSSRNPQPYLIYVGRIDPGKGTDMLVRYFLQYVQEENAALKLYMVGKAGSTPVAHPSIIYTGFLEEEKKIQLMKDAKALVIPSAFESLSLVLLESFSYGVPVIANGASEVLADHIAQSQGGWLFQSYEDFKRAVQQLDEPASGFAGKSGREYVLRQYNWDKVLDDYIIAIRDIERSELS